jgi:hypothetical protein
MTGTTFIRDRPVLLAATAVLALTVLVFLPSLGNGFVSLDDHDYVEGNPGIGLALGELAAWAFTTYRAYNYHPLTWLSLALDHAFWGLDPFGYHLTSVLLHAANGALVVVLAWLLIRRARAAGEPGPPALREVLAAAAAGALFSIHPLRVESVTWISERKDVLFAFFYLLSLIAYVRFTTAVTPGRRAVLYAASLALFCLSALSKPMAVSLPAVLLLLDACPLRRIDGPRPVRRMLSLLPEKAPFVLVAVGLAVLTILAQGTSGQIRDIQELPIGERGVIALRAVFFYLGKTLWPAGLAPFYPILQPVTLTVMDAVRIAAFLGITGLGIALWKRNRLPLTAWAFYIVTLIPVSGIVQVGGQAAADRYSYLPLLGPLVGVVAAIAAASARLSVAFPRVRPDRLLLAVLCAVLLLLGRTTAGQQAVWKDSVALWSREIEVFPYTVPLGYSSRARAFALAGDHRRAAADYTTALMMDPLDGQTYAGRALSLLALGRQAQACADLEQAVRLDPARSEAVFLLKRSCR